MSASLALLAGGLRRYFNIKCNCSPVTRIKGKTNFHAVTFPFTLSFVTLFIFFTHQICGETLGEALNATSTIRGNININVAKRFGDLFHAEDLNDISSREHYADDNQATANLSGHFTSLPPANRSNGALNINGDIGLEKSGERLPIREIVSEPDGDVKAPEGGEEFPPHDSERQLTDITGKAAARKLPIVPVKNGSLQRDVEKRENQIKGKSLGTVSRDKIGKIVVNFSIETEKNSLEKNIEKNLSNILDIGSVKNSDLPQFLPPQALISDDCSEMKHRLSNKTSSSEDRDMEFKEQDRNPYRKMSSLSTDRFLSASKSISHVHSYDKSRRAIIDNNNKSLNLDPNDNVKSSNWTNFDKKKRAEFKVNKDIPFETEVTFKMDSNISSFPWESSKPILTKYSSTRKEIKDQQITASTTVKEGSYDYLLKKAPVNKLDKGQNSVHNFDAESRVKTGPDSGVVIKSPSVLNISKVQDKEEKRFASHVRDRDTVIRFSATLPREKYITPTLKLSEGTFIFRFLSGFFTFLHPFDFPTELLRDVMWNTLSVPQLILQSLRVEVGFISAIIFSLILALVVPTYGLCCALLRVMGGPSRSGGGCSVSPPPPGAMGESGGRCEKRVCLMMMLVLVVLSFLGVGAMVLGNESACNGAAQVQELLTAAARDVPAYTRAAHQGLSHALLHSADQAIAAAEHDLDRADFLLGEPIQKALAAETGVDVALDALNDISAVSLELSNKVSALGACGSRAAALATAARERLRDLRRQADAARRHCASRDRPLCETADTAGIELVMHFDMVTEERLEPLADILNAGNLTEAAESARKKFSDIPKTVANQTSYVIEDIREALQMQKAELRVAERSFAKVARHLAAEATSAALHIENIVRAVDAVEFWRWLVFLVAVLLICLVMLLHIFGVSCGCCGMESQAGSILKTSVITMCFFAIPLWILTIVVFVAGGHGEVFLCRPLYDDPEFTVLGKLLDRPGLLYRDGSGLFEEVLKGMGNITIDVPVKEILRECKKDRPAYPVFRLRGVLDLNVATAHYNWSALDGAAARLSALAPAPAQSLAAPRAHQELRIIMNAATSINFTEYRFQLNGPLTGKDLSSLADQFESIGNQITDLTTSSRIETLASRTRRLVINTMQPLDQMRTDLVFRLTELELQLQPFQKQMNQSLSHLKTIQYYFDNQGAIIAQKKTQEYVKRITGYLEQFRGHVLNEVEHNVAPCGPIWDIYDATRSLVCRHYIDSLNGFWFGLCGCLLVWICAAPLALRLRRACAASIDRKEGLLLRTISHQTSSDNNVIAEQSAWSTPGEPLQSDHWR